jgi:3'(2'), 5'-bisphosphate nucleotidase
MRIAQDLDEEKQAAIGAVVQAAELCQAVRTEMASVDSLEKGDKSPVTVADFGSQALICRRLSIAFPYDPLVGEEDSTDLQKPGNAHRLAQVTQYVQRFQPDANAEAACRWIDAGKGNVSERFWTLDPIDGTQGFLRNDQYAIALALVEQGKVQVAVLGCPVLPFDLDDPDGESGWNTSAGVLFVAVRGQGAAMAPLSGGGDRASFAPIRVTQESDETRWRFVESVEASHGHPALQEAVAQAVGFTHPPLRMDSQAKYGAVARGDAALYLRLPSPQSPDYREKIWDHAAGSLVVEEAGGCVTDMYGYPLDLASGYRMHSNRGVVVSNGTLHIAALKALRSHRP